MYVGCGEKYYSYSNPNVQGTVYCKADLYFQENRYEVRPTAALNNVGKAYYYNPDIAIFDDMSGQKYLAVLSCSAQLKYNFSKGGFYIDQSLEYQTYGNLYSTGGWMAYRDTSVSNKFYLIGTTGNGTINYVRIDPDQSYDKITGTFTVQNEETIIPLQSLREGNILMTIQNNTIRNYKIDESGEQPELKLISTWDSSEIYKKFFFLPRYLNTSTLFKVSHVILFHMDYLVFTSQYQRFENVIALYRPYDETVQYFALNFNCEDNITSDGQNTLLCHQTDSVISVDLNNLLQAPQDFEPDIASCYMISDCVSYVQTTKGDKQYYNATLKNSSSDVCQQCDDSRDINLFYESMYEKVMFQNVNNIDNCTINDINGTRKIECDEEQIFVAEISNLPATNSVFASNSFVNKSEDGNLISSQSVSQDNGYSSCYEIQGKYAVNITDNFIYFYLNDSSLPTCVADQPSISASITSAGEQVTVQLKPQNITKYGTPVTYFAYLDPAFKKTITNDVQVDISITLYTTTNQIFRTSTTTYTSNTTITSCFQIQDSIDAFYYADKQKLVLQPSYILGRRFQQPCSMNVSSIDDLQLNITFNNATTLTFDQYNFEQSKQFNNIQEKYISINPNYDEITDATVYSSVNNNNLTLKLNPKLIKLPCAFVEDAFRVYQDEDNTYIIYYDTSVCNAERMPVYDQISVQQNGDEYEIDDYETIEGENGINKYIYTIEDKITGQINITYNISLFDIIEFQIKEYKNVNILSIEQEQESWYIILIVYIVIFLVYGISIYILGMKRITGVNPLINTQSDKYEKINNTDNKQDQKDSFDFSSENEDDLLAQDSENQDVLLDVNPDENELFDVPQ